MKSNGIRLAARSISNNIYAVNPHLKYAIREKPHSEIEKCESLSHFINKIIFNVNSGENKDFKQMQEYLNGAIKALGDMRDLAGSAKGDFREIIQKRYIEDNKKLTAAIKKFEQWYKMQVQVID
jgi:hypothetical protein